MGDHLVNYADVIPESSVTFDDVDSTHSEIGSSKNGSTICVLSTNGDVNEEVGNPAEVLARIELDLACTSERLCNLNIFMMHAATKEAELEVFDSEKEEEDLHLVEKTLEFDFLSSYLESQVRELDSVMDSLKREILDAHQAIRPNEHSGTFNLVIEEKLCDLEKTLEQLQEHIDELHEQSAAFQKTLSCFHGEDTGDKEKDVALTDNGEPSDMTTKTKQQTAEQQRHFLRMLEKSLARELDIEKKITESKEIEGELISKLQSTQQDLSYLEEEMFNTLERFFQADNSAETLMGISKELLGRLQIAQFNLNSYSHREAELSMKFVESEKKLTAANSEVSTLRQTVSTLESQLRKNENQMVSVEASKVDMDTAIKDLSEKLSKEQSRAESAEAQSKLMAHMTSELKNEVARFRDKGITPERVDSLERKLRDTDNLLQHAVASSEASEEKQNMLYSAIKDMEHTIEDLKIKVGRSELRADSAEDNCISLSEANAELSDELSFLRGKMQCLEGSLHQSEHIKLAAAKDIRLRTNVMANLVMQLAIERDRLHKKMSSIVKDNKVLVIKLHQTSKENSDLKSHDSGSNAGKDRSSSHEKESRFPAKIEKNSTIARPTSDSTTSKVEGSRRIDAGMLSFKHLLVIGLILVGAVASMHFF